VVLLDDRAAVAAIAARTGDRPPRLAINQVGGDSALTLAKAAAPGGTVVTIGAMSRQPVTVPAGLLIFKDIRFTGYWITTWYRTAPASERDAMFARLAALVDAGTLVQPVAATYPLAGWRDALAHAGRDARGGKILFDLAD
jgi:NADPH:quinone reductase-like Zn-dependent oxidoreductase